MKPEPHRIEWLDEVDSTNAEALRRAAGGETGPLWIAARRQSAGKGRSGRRWTSLPGNLFATLLMSPQAPMARLGELALVAGIAAHAAVNTVLPRPAMAQMTGGLRIKWPNDLEMSGAKLAGILSESVVTAGAQRVAIGFGINVAAAPVRDTRAATCLAALGTRATAEDVLWGLAEAMSLETALWADGSGLAQILTRWAERSAPFGTPMTVNTEAGQVSGAFAGLAADGALLIDTSAGRRRVTFGDVTMEP